MQKRDSETQRAKELLERYKVRLGGVTADVCRGCAFLLVAAEGSAASRGSLLRA